MCLRAAFIFFLSLHFWGAEPETAAIFFSRVPLFPPVSQGAVAVERQDGHAGVGRCQHAPPLSVCRRALRLRGGAREGRAASRPEEHDSDSLSSALVQMPWGHACSSGTGSAGGTDEGSSNAGTGEHISDDSDGLGGPHSLKRRMPARRVAHDEKRRNLDGRGVPGDGWEEEVAEEGRGRAGGGSEHVLSHDMREEERRVLGGGAERPDAVNVLPVDEAESVSSSSSSSPLSSFSSSGEFPTIEQLLVKAEKWEQEHMATQHKGGGGGGEGGGEGMGEEADLLCERDKGGGLGGGRGGDEEAEWGFRFRVLPERYGRSLLTIY